MSSERQNNRLSPWRRRLYEIIFEADTPGGKLFDIALLVAILLSVLAVVLESVVEIASRHGLALRIAEWTFTLVFSVEYVLRIVSLRKPGRYIFSFLGIVDLLSFLPSFIGLLVPGAHALTVVRALRLLRIFRILKLARYMNELTAMLQALRRSQFKITVFLMAVLILVLILGTLMYVVEGEAAGFTSIPRGIYWAIVTITTVGYGDITPRTVLGQALAAMAMIIGYSLIIIPAAIFSMEMVQAARKQVTTQTCPECVREGHDVDATHCKYCGTELNPD